MKKQRLKLGTVACVFLAYTLSVSADDAVGVDGEIVQPAGPMPGKRGKRYLDVLGRDYVDQASFGIVEFDATDLGLGTVTGVERLEVNLTQVVQSYSFEGMLRICVFLTNDLSFSSDDPEIFFDLSEMMGLGVQGSGGYQRYEMDDMEYMPGADGDVDTFSFDITAGSRLEQILTRQINTGGVIRICLCPMEMDGNEDVAATYAGFTHPTVAYRPTLSITPR